MRGSRILVSAEEGTLVVVSRDRKLSCESNLQQVQMELVRVGTLLLSGLIKTFKNQCGSFSSDTAPVKFSARSAPINFAGLYT